MTVKNKVSATEAGIKEVLSIREYEKLEAALAVIKSQHNDLTKLQALLPQKGISSKAIEEKVNSIIEALNRCMCDMPISEESIANSLRCATGKIRDYQGKDNLKDAEAYLYSAIQELKKSIEDVYKRQMESCSLSAMRFA